MTNTLTPQQVIRAQLAAPRIVLAKAPASGMSGWQVETTSVGFDARPESIQFVKMRGIPHCEVHAVTFETTAGRAWHFICCVREDSAGAWHFDDGAGGGADCDPPYPEPRANLGGGGWPHRFYAGGTVVANGLDIARVRLQAANGTLLEDTVDNGVVVFVTTEEVRTPLHAELFDPAGTLVSSHNVFGRGPRGAIDGPTKERDLSCV